MKPKIISNHVAWDEVVIRCAVGCDDFVIFTTDLDEGDEDWIEVNVVAEMRPHNFMEMLKGCWSLFRHGRWHRAAVSLDTRRLVEIREWCSYILDKTDAE